MFPADWKDQVTIQREPDEANEDTFDKAKKSKENEAKEEPQESGLCEEGRLQPGLPSGSPGQSQGHWNVPSHDSCAREITSSLQNQKNARG